MDNTEKNFFEEIVDSALSEKTAESKDNNSFEEIVSSAFSGNREIQAEIIKDAETDAEASSESKPKKKKRKKLKRLIIAALLVAATAFYIRGYVNYQSRFFPKTEIDGISIGELTVQEAEEKLKSMTALTSVTVHGREDAAETIGIPLADAFRKYEGLDKVLDEQNEALWFLDSLNNIEPELDSYMSFDREGLKNDLSKMQLLSEENARKPEDAKVVFHEKTGVFVADPEDNGTVLRFDRLCESVQKGIELGESDIVLDDGPDGCYENADIKLNDRIVSETETLNRFNEMKITLDMGAGVTEEISGCEIIEYFGKDKITASALDKKEKLSADEDRLRAFVEKLSEKYDTSDNEKPHQFLDHQKVTRWISTDYGWKLDEKKTVNALKICMEDMAEKKQSHGLMDNEETVEAVWEKAAASHDSPDYGDWYVEVDLTEQHAYLYKGGELLWESDCVSGLNVSKGRRTPELMDAVDFKARNKTLTGYKSDGSIDYQSFVHYWMPFHGGIGLHDATWRYKFGGTAYIHGGSHGCINLPYKKAMELFELIEVGTPVVTYY